MKIAVFTSCQPRHTSLIERLAKVADTVYACIEVRTLFPGQNEDLFHATDVMGTYFAQMQAAEVSEFGKPRYLPENVRVFPMKSEDINKLAPSDIRLALECDVAIVFGASYIRPPIVDALVDRGALNIHMGTCPYYRGSGCNFWAIYDGYPEYVGGTIHSLTRGLDTGPMLGHALPNPRDGESLDGFALGMRSVSDAFDALIDLITTPGWKDLEPIPQDKSLEMRYSRTRDFTDEIASEYLGNLPSVHSIQEAIKNRDPARFILLSDRLKTLGY